MAEDPLHQILLTLGRLEEGQTRMRVDFDAEREHTRESRERTYVKLEKLEEDLGIVGQVAAQARQQTVETRKLVDEEIKPVTDDVKRMRMLGLGIMGLLGFAFTTLGITLATVGEGSAGRTGVAKDQLTGQLDLSPGAPVPERAPTCPKFPVQFRSGSRK